MKLLIADDDAVTRKRLKKILTTWGHDVIAVTDGLEAWNALSREDAPRLALLDWLMPEINGLELCRRIREERPSEFAYLILLTAKNRKQDVAEGIEAGADDYLSKPIDLQDLRVRLRAADRIVAFHEALLNQATHDSLTGILNRRAVLDALQRELERGRRTLSPVGVIMADIDHFKLINDTHGHPAGDAVLREVAQHLSAVVRPSDSIGRYGGEEFLMVLPGSNREDTCAAAERMRATIAAVQIPGTHGPIPVTLSLGAAASGRDGREAEELIRHADDALYCAKARGRNCVDFTAYPEGALNLQPLTC